MIRWLSSAKNHYRTIIQLRPIAALIQQQPVLTSSLLITGLLLGMGKLESLQLLELVAFDQMLRLKPDAEPDPRIVVVEITETDIQAQKQWPLSDLTIARLLEKLQSYQPKVIGLDLYRDIPYQPGHLELRKQLQAPNVVVITKHSDDADGKGVPPPAGVPKERIGFNDFVLDPDGVIRRNFMYTQLNGEEFYSFSLRVSLSYLRDQNITFKANLNHLQIGASKLTPLESKDGGYENIDAQGYQTLLNYRSRKSAPSISLSQILNQPLNPNPLKNKIILIGTTAPSQKDTFFTPYNATNRQQALTPGVFIHAQMVSQILSHSLNQQRLYWFWPQWGELLWTWTWALLGGILVWRIRHPLTLGLAGSIALAGLFAIGFSCFLHTGWIPLVAPALAFLGTASSIGIYKLFHDTVYDSLTGLPNRALFVQRVQTALTRPKPGSQPSLLAVIFLDLDRFKVINESFGHPVGDRLLVAVSHRLKTALHPRDTVARVGGDEFAILLSPMSHVSQATGLVDQLQQQLALPFQLQGQELFTSASVGIALNQAGLTYQPEDLLRDAHTAMYRAKALGKARYEVFSQGMHQQVVSRLQLESDLRRGIERGEFYLNYQPIVSLATGEIAGFEALVRWRHPSGQFVSPAEFIPVAEETGLIVPLGGWILHQSCLQLRRWQQEFPRQPPLMLSVNLSMQQFAQPDLVSQIEEILTQTGLDGGTLKLEITETMAMSDVEATIAAILRLKGLSLRFSIDDFGTGYSSLSYLHRLPVDTLKVDRSFVGLMEEASENGAIVQTIILLGHGLGLDVVAEGVETASQMQRLRQLGCEYGQGYFFARPLDAAAAAALLASQKRW